jgi:hypothetical protein
MGVERPDRKRERQGAQTSVTRGAPFIASAAPFIASAALGGALAVLGLLGACSNGTGSEAPEAGSPPDGALVPRDGGSAAPTPCDPDAFTGVGTACPVVSPVLCFPVCEAGGCLCEQTPDGPRWRCILDNSCLPACAPIDDACTE